MTTFFPRCLECGGQIEPVAREGRTYEIVKGHHLIWPSEMTNPQKYSKPSCVLK